MNRSQTRVLNHHEILKQDVSQNIETLMLYNVYAYMREFYDLRLFVRVVIMCLLLAFSEVFLR